MTAAAAGEDDGDPGYDGSNTTGFVSPAADALEGPIDLAAMLDLRRPHRYPVRVLGEALRERGILPGDVLIANTAAPPTHGRVATPARSCRPGRYDMAEATGEVIRRRPGQPA